ncbi:MAG: protein phosphatase 2C domain-containing protein [Candidatus Amulumruptor caecigallinarius]|nr:protein phosphatase 2C domain-containing protein [Candidatus Amulumruptor caecigallinarius]
MDAISDSYGISASIASKRGGREENQDHYGMAETPLGLLVVVCDGMGGGPAGKTASTIAVSAIIDSVSGVPLHMSPVAALENACHAANESVLDAVRENPALRGMGTTCVAVLLCRDGHACVMHVGDSRCYQLRKGKGVFHTADHSYVGEMVRRGTITAEEARNSRYSNVITRAIGVGESVEPEIDELKYLPGDRFALMSDGVWGAVSEPQLVVLLCSDDTPSQLVREVTDHIDNLGESAGGGHDNLTLAVVDIPCSGSARHILDKTAGNHKDNRNKPTPHIPLYGWICVAVVIVIAATVGLWLCFPIDNPGASVQPNQKAESRIAAQKKKFAEITGEASKNYENAKSDVSKGTEARKDVEYLGSALSKLEMLRGYNKTGADTNPHKVRNERERIYDRLVEDIMNAGRHATPGLQAQISNLAESVKKSEKKRRLISIYNKDCTASAESLEAIRQLENDINAIIK